MLRTGSDSISRLIATGAASSEVRRLTGGGRARAATTPSATTSSSVPKVQPQPRACSAARVSGLRTSPPKGVPVNCVESYSEPFTCRTPSGPTQVSRSVSRSALGVPRTAATCLTARTATTARARHGPPSAVPHCLAPPPRRHLPLHRRAPRSPRLVDLPPHPPHGYHLPHASHLYDFPENRIASCVRREHPPLHLRDPGPCPALCPAFHLVDDSRPEARSSPSIATQTCREGKPDRFQAGSDIGGPKTTMLCPGPA